MSDQVESERVGAVTVVRLRRPEAHNALSLGSWVRLAEIFDGLASEPRLRVVVVRGVGEKAFSAGANIAEFPELRMTAEDAP